MVIGMKNDMLSLNSHSGCLHSLGTNILQKDTVWGLEECFLGCFNKVTLPAKRYAYCNIYAHTIQVWLDKTHIEHIQKKHSQQSAGVQTINSCGYCVVRTTNAPDRPQPTLLTSANPTDKNPLPPPKLWVKQKSRLVWALAFCN